MNWREFRRDSRGKSAPLVWKIKQDGETYHTEHGLLGGAVQKFSDTPGCKGKEGTKAFVNAVDNAKFNVEREIRLKLEHGYIEYVDGEPTTETITCIFFDKMLPKNFCSYKPQTSISESTLKKIHEAGKARYTRKYDGQCHIAVHHVWGWEIYSRRMDLASERFPNHIAELQNTSFNVGTILIGEIVCQRSNGTDDFKSTSRICRSDPPIARKLVEDKEVTEPLFLIFDMLFHNGKDLSQSKYDDRVKIWRSYSGSLVKPVEYHDVTPDNWESVAKSNDWEGFVITDGDSVPGNKFYSFDGSSQRPKGHHKLKPVMTEDVVVYAAAVGAGKRLGKIGALFVKQIDPDTGKYFDCGKVGSGFTDEDIDYFTKLCQEKNIPILNKDTEVKKLSLDDECSVVIEIEFGERQEGSNKFRFPVFLRIRNDKASEECLANI